MFDNLETCLGISKAVCHSAVKAYYGARCYDHKPRPPPPSRVHYLGLHRGQGCPTPAGPQHNPLMKPQYPRAAYLNNDEQNCSVKSSTNKGQHPFMLQSANLVVNIPELCALLYLAAVSKFLCCPLGLCSQLGWDRLNYMPPELRLPLHLPHLDLHERKGGCCDVPAELIGKVVGSGGRRCMWHMQHEVPR